MMERSAPNVLVASGAFTREELDDSSLPSAMSSADVSSDLNDLRALCESLAARVAKLEARIHTLETGEILPPKPPPVGDAISAALRRYTTPDAYGR